MRIYKYFLLSMLLILINSCNWLNKKEDFIELIPFKLGDVYGYFDLKGKIVINPQFSYASTFKNGLAKVITKGEKPKIGYINTNGNFIVQPKYDQGTDFNEEIAIVVTQNGYPVAIDKEGETLFNFKQAESVSFFSDGLCAFSILKDNEEHWGFVNKNGKQVIPPIFKNVLFFTENKCVVQNENGKFGYIDNSGVLVVNYQFDFASPFKNGTAVVEIDNKKGVINDEGKFIINPQYSEIIIDEDNYIFSQDGKYGWMDKDGKIKINPQFEQALPFNDNLALVKSGGKYGYINKNGSFEVNPQFDYALPFNGDMAIVKLGSKFGLINKEGKYTVNPQFEGINPEIFLSDNSSEYLLYLNRNVVVSDFFDIDEILNYFSLTSFDGHTLKSSFKAIASKYNLNPIDFIYSRFVFLEKELNSNVSFRIEADGNYVDFDKKLGKNFFTNNTPHALTYIINFKNRGKDKSLLVFEAFKEKFKSLKITKKGYFGSDEVILYDFKDHFIFILTDNENKIELGILKKNALTNQILSKITDFDTSYLSPYELNDLYEKQGYYDTYNDYEEVNTETIEVSTAETTNEEKSKSTANNIIKAEPYEGMQTFRNNFIRKFQGSQVIENYNNDISFKISFIIEKDGSLNNLQINDQIPNDIKDEVFRILRSMPTWKPAMEQGNPVRSSFTLPINIKTN